MDDYDQMPRKKRKAGIGGKLAMIAVVLIIIVVAIFAYYFIGGPISVAGPTAVTVSSKGAVFAMAGKSYVATLVGYNNNTKTAYVYVSQVPVFLNPVLNITLHQNNTVKINYNGQYSIMQMTLLSGSKGSAKVQMAPLSPSLQVDPDYQYINHPSVQLPGLQITVTSTSTAPTTTVGSGGSTSASTTTVAATTTAATTTVAAANGTAAAISTALKDDSSYTLMLNFGVLYNETANCTASQYSNTYFEENAALPSGQFSYQNMSYETPHGLIVKTTNEGGGNYNVTSLPQVGDPQFNNVPALTISLTVKPSGATTIATVNSNQFGGIFEGATYAELSSEYTQTKSVGNACAALIG